MRKAQHKQADRGREGVFNFAGERHNGKHNPFCALAGFPLDIVHGFGFHFFLNQIFAFQRNGGKTGKEHNQDTGRQRDCGAGFFVHQAVVAGHSEQKMQHNSNYTARLIEPLGIRFAAEAFHNFRNDQTGNQKAGEFHNINKDIVFGGKH